MKEYVLLFGDKKPEDNLCIRNMFTKSEQINIGWTDFDYETNKKRIEQYIKKGIEQFIFSGLEIGWDKLIIDIKQKDPKIKIKVICNTQDSLLYYDYERENFFKLLELSKDGWIQDIAFLRKGQYHTYKSLGYQCSYLQENYMLKENKKLKIKTSNEKIDLGIYPLNYTWDKNIFNQLCVGKFIENCTVNYNNLNERMEEFLNEMKIDNFPDKVEKVEEELLLKKLCRNDVILATSFTEYMHPVFLMSMELGIPCLIGNHSDFFENKEELKKYVVTNAEDNAIINAQIVKKMIYNKEEIQKLYKNWKEKYNQKAKKSIEDFVNQ